MKDLPKFKARPREHVVEFVSRVLTQPNKPDVSYFRRLVEYEDGHYGVEFDLSYFIFTEVPTKSQWGSLKKKLKRHDKKVFVFKEHCIVTCDRTTPCGFLEFGFFTQ